MTDKPLDFYIQQIENQKNTCTNLARKEVTNGFARLTIFVGAFVVFFLVFQTSFVLAILLCISGLFIFGYLVRKGLKIQRQLLVAKKLQKLYRFRRDMPGVLNRRIRIFLLSVFPSRLSRVQ